MKRTASLASVASLALLAAAQGTILPAQPAPTTGQPASAAQKDAPVIALDALDSMKSAVDFESAIRKSARAKPPAIVVVIPATLPSRTDGLRIAVIALKDAKLPIVVYTTDAGKELSPAALALGVSAAHWGTGFDDVGAVTVPLRPESAQRDLVEEKMPWESYEADLRELLAPKFAARKWFAQSADVIYGPKHTWWAALDGKQWTVTKDKPAPAAGRRVELLSDEGRQREFNTLLAPLVQAGSAPEKSGSWDQLCRTLKIKTAAKADTTVGVPLAKVLSSVIASEAKAKGALSGLADAIQAITKGKIDRTPDPAQIRSLKELLAQAETAIGETETLLNSYPEILRTVPPGKTTAGAKPASQPARWRAAIDQYRKDAEAAKQQLDKLGAK